ncbi:MAG: hypothetical protein ABI442_08585 [Gemmatimonadaceae bacterium]
MNGSALLKTPAIRVALAILTFAFVVFGWTVVRAMRPDPLPPVAATAVASLDGITHRIARTTIDVNAAVENDVFSPDRSPPTGSYRLPGEASPTDKPVFEAQRPTVLGTAVATDGRSFATMQLGDSGPRLVHVGDKIGEWVVRTIERGKVTLVSAAGVRADITVGKTGL